MKTIKILFIEDEKLLKTLLEDTITGFREEYKNFNFDMETAVDLKSAMTYLEEKSAPDIIILDLRLPIGDVEEIKKAPEKENGLTVLKLIKTDIKFRNTPVIIFTNLNDKETEHECNKLGANSFMIKSKVLPSELLNEIVRLVK
ncbi:response regulator [Patescibacteria group bacterium]|nr:response regulator [Patescibacteria group bacterium]